MATCHICPAHDNQFDDRDMFDHVRCFHPDWDAQVERWPDGSPVVVDMTLEPSDFGGA